MPSITSTPNIFLFPTDYFCQSPLKSRITHCLTTPKIRQKIKVLIPSKPSRAFFNLLIHSKAKVLAVMMISDNRGLVPGPLYPSSVAGDACGVEARFAVPLAVEPAGPLSVVVELDVYAVVKAVVPGAFGAHAGLGEGEEKEERGNDVDCEMHSW